LNGIVIIVVVQIDSKKISLVVVRIAILSLLVTLFIPRGEAIEKHETVARGLAQPGQACLSSNTALERYIKRLEQYQVAKERAGVFIADSSGKRIFASHNPDSLFNPASLLKLAITAMALEKWPPSHRFSTFIRFVEFTPPRALGMQLHGTGDPLLRRRQLNSAFKTLNRYGINSIRGPIEFSREFRIHSRHDSSLLSQTVIADIGKAGIRTEDSSIFIDNLRPRGTVFASRYSPPLDSILLYMNAHSSNAIAERLGQLLGGADAVQSYLRRLCADTGKTIVVDSPAGFGHNRMSPLQVDALIHHLQVVLRQKNLAIEQVLPLAGVNGSTLGRRLRDPQWQAKLAGKTGTLIMTDNGVSCVAGIIRTTDYGDLRFTILNHGGEVRFFIREQDRFIRDFCQTNDLVLVKIAKKTQHFGNIYYRTAWQYTPKYVNPVCICSP
jgi:D-alanyl-D-alanine carboxypeptidase